MPEPLKNMFDLEFVARLSADIKSVYPKFEAQAFTNSVCDDEWEGRELKDRMRHISESLHAHLPDNYEISIDILMKVAPNYTGFTAIIFPDFVELYGMDNFDLSVKALELFTECCSSEFAVRPFIIRYEKPMMTQMKKWASSNNHHHRRLASEGCRSRLPWAMALPKYKKDPSLVLEILDILKDDESEYVRRSVANNLNDISKDNPDITLDIAKKWLGINKNRDALIKHACRTLLKDGSAETLTLFGFTDPAHIYIENFKNQDEVKLGDDYFFSFTMKSDDKHLGLLRVEYGIYFLRKNGSHSRKVFKISETDNDVAEKSVTRKQSFRAITTRAYYPGDHYVSVIINGKELAKEKFVVID